MRTYCEDIALVPGESPSFGEDRSDDRALKTQCGSVEFFVGPSKAYNGGLRSMNWSDRDQPLVELAMVAAAYGKTTLIDGCGGAVIFGEQRDGNVELF
jgi:hypothetical protein